ncbi:AraC family transcriptional regulator [Cytophagaceae bacterium YF14B1]|uniref:AraC family transcriptional regulator n=1 Tax=Xanthocytophaga flava TaxID=3048013 RepID=A0AAE3QU94_9BACT|nr:AraC family transcriptional regulator [Xanthocytophaga flavus]MDJ1482904.1 AraC family transcriptional regulator [Xanthocytophaga flavus]
MKAEDIPYIYNSISEFQRDMGLPKPLHPLISVVRLEDIRFSAKRIETKIALNFYKISFIEGGNRKIRYGQTYFDFDEGGLFFISPGQVISVGSPTENLCGLTIYLHPDLIRNHNLGKKIKDYGFFSYSMVEALHLSEKEKNIILGLFHQIQMELDSAIDTFSQELLASYVELLLDYSNRFYTRQFITRKTAHNDLLDKLDTLLSDYFRSGKALHNGLPTVQFVSEQLNFSSDYLSDMLRTYTGQSTQQHIHNKLIEVAKELISTSNLTIAEVAYQLGFEHPQSFTKLFKQKTDLSPMVFRHSFN